MDVFEKVTPLASELGVKADALRKWRERRTVPGVWHLLLLDKARERGVKLNKDELLATTKQGRAV